MPPSDPLLSRAWRLALKPWEAEHLTLGVVGLYQPITVEEDTSQLQEISSPRSSSRHEAQGHPPGPQLLGLTSTL